MAEEHGTNVRLVKPNVRKIMRPYMNIGVYVRVSSSLRPQLDSMANQVSAFTQRVNQNNYWRLADIYIDVRSGSETGNRSEFRRMLDDARDGKLDQILNFLNTDKPSSPGSMISIITICGLVSDHAFQNDSALSKPIASNPAPLSA